MSKAISETKLEIGLKNLEELKRLVDNLNKAIEELNKFEVEISISKPY
jgi:hypothetical protein